MPDNYDAIDERLRQAEEAARDREERRTKGMVVAFAEQVAKMLAPVLREMRQMMKVDSDDLRDALKNIKVESRPIINVPAQPRPIVNVPEPKVTVRVPEIKIPPLNMPAEMDIKGWVRLMTRGSEVGLENPLPVTLRDADGKPMTMGDFTQIISGAGGGGARHVTINNQSGNPVPVEITSGSSSGTEYTEGDTDASITGTAALAEAASDVLYALRLGAGHDSAQALRVTHATDAVVSVNIVSGSSSGTEYTDGSTAGTTTGTVIMGDTGEESNNVWALATAGGAVSSSVLRVVHAADAAVSVNIVSGSSSGTEYTDGSTASTTTGTVIMGDTGEESGNVFSLATASGATGSNVLRVSFATDAIASVNIVSGAASGTQYSNGATANPPTGTVAMGNTGEESGNIFALATHSGVTGSSVLRVVQATDSVSSVSVTNTVTVDTELPTAATLADATANPSLPGVAAYLLGFNGSTWDRAHVLLSTSEDESTQTGIVTVPMNRVWDGSAWDRQPGNSTDGTLVNLGANNDVVVSGSLSSTVAVGDIPSDGADTGSPPVKVGGIARTNNPTAVADGDRVSFTADKLGRQLMRPVQVRAQTLTAYATLSNGTETTLLSAQAGFFTDLIYVMAANTSGSAITIDIRAVSGGNVVATIVAPASGTAGVSLPVPIPSGDSGNAWTVDMGDFTNTTVYISALFSKEL